MSGVQSTAFKRVMIAVDGSENAKKATRVAALLARVATNPELIVLHVATLPVSLNRGGDTDLYVESAQRAKEDNERILEDASREAQSLGVTTRKVLRDNRESVVKTILESSEAEGVDLIVVGTRGLGGFERLLLGSVANGLATNAHCSVLVVR